MSCSPRRTWSMFMEPARQAVPTTQHPDSLAGRLAGLRGKAGDAGDFSLLKEREESSALRGAMAIPRKPRHMAEFTVASSANNVLTPSCSLQVVRERSCS